MRLAWFWGLSLGVVACFAAANCGAVTLEPLPPEEPPPEAAPASAPRLVRNDASAPKGPADEEEQP